MPLCGLVITRRVLHTSRVLQVMVVKRSLSCQSQPYRRLQRNRCLSLVEKGAVAATVAVALMAAEAFNEKSFFEAAQRGDTEELNKQVAAAKGATAEEEACEWLEDEKPSVADTRHRLGWTALMVAAANAHADAVARLLELGAEPRLKDVYDGEEPTRRELDFHPDMNPRASYRGWTALHYAALSDCADCVEFLLRAGADARATDARRRRAHHYARRPLRRRLEDAAQRPPTPRTQLEPTLRRALVGQRSAVEAVSAAVRRKERGWADAERPLVFLFLGGSGVGKTELAKRLARHLHSEEGDAFVRLDMSEYQERHEVAKLIGAPPGYVGHDEGGVLTGALARRPDALVLLDEVDKAHPDVLTVLLQLFDEGRVTDGKGTLVECREAVFVMTSNLCAKPVAEAAPQLREGGAACPRWERERVLPELKKHFGRDEFIGRIDEIVYFVPFELDEVHALLERELRAWARIARAKHGLSVRWQEGALEALASHYAPAHGVRSLRRAVLRLLVGRLALAQERGLLPEGASVLVDASADLQVLLLVRAPGEDMYTPLPL